MIRKYYYRFLDFLDRKFGNARTHVDADEYLAPAPLVPESDENRLINLRVDFAVVEANIEATRAKYHSINAVAKKYRDIYESMKLDAEIEDINVEISSVGVSTAEFERQADRLQDKFFRLSGDKLKLQREIERLAVKMQADSRHFSPQSPEPIPS